MAESEIKLATIQCCVSLSPWQKYLHESRHRHAMQRKRGDGGRFFSPKDKEEMALALAQVRSHV